MTKERQQKDKAPWTSAAQPTNILCTVIYFIIIFILIIMQKQHTTLQATMQFNSEHNRLLCKNTDFYNPNPQPNPQTFLSVMPILKLLYPAVLSFTAHTQRDNRKHNLLTFFLTSVFYQVGT